jgi:hypothetical protein
MSEGNRFFFAVSAASAVDVVTGIFRQITETTERELDVSLGALGVLGGDRQTQAGPGLQPGRVRRSIL